MAAEPVLHLLLWGLLAVSVPGALASWCNVSCATDYRKWINCSCSDVPLTDRVLVHVTCRDEDLTVSGACHIAPPRSRCSMLLEDLSAAASVGTTCTTDVSQQGGGGDAANETFSWELEDMVKPAPPYDVRVASAELAYQITWSADGVDSADTLTFRVRLKARSGGPQEVARLIPVGGRSLLLDHQWLRPGVEYVADVQSKMTPENVYRGPWSEWSPAAAWKTPAAEGLGGAWWFVSLPVVLVLAVLLLGYLHKPCWQKKLRLVSFVPNPDKFFQPLYIKHQGNFGDWVKPAFGEYDYVGAGPAEKQPDVLRWSDEKRRHSEGGEPPHGLALLQALGSELPEGADRSTGHVSILTVTLSGDDWEEDGGSLAGESFGSLEDDAPSERAGFGPDEPPPPLPPTVASGRQSGAAHQQGNRAFGQLPEEEEEEPRAGAMEPERASLHSLASSGQSEDGYPRVDLDTIDSGFGDCGSPPASGGEPAHSQFFQQPHSNYVKQWMIGGSEREEAPQPDAAQDAG